MGLSKEQLEQFDTDGYLVVENVLEDADIDPVIEEYSAHIDRRAHELLDEGKISSLHEEESFEQRLASICKENGEIYPELDIPPKREAHSRLSIQIVEV